MPIQLNAPNLSALSSVSGGNGIPNLPSPGALGLQALQAGNANRNAMLDRRQQAEQAFLQRNVAQQQMANQAAMANQQNQLEQQKLAQQNAQFGQNAQLDAAKMAQQDNQFNQNLDVTMDRNAIDKQRADQEGAAKQMAKLLDMDKKDLQARGAFAAYGLMSIKGAKTPEEANLIRNEIVKEAVAKKHISAEEGAAASKAPISQFTAMLGQQLIATGQAAEYASMVKANAPAKSTAGTQIEFNEDGTIKSISQDPNTAVKTEVQKDLLNREKGLQQLANIRDKFDPANFTYAGKMGRGASAIAELAKGTPGLEQASELAAKTITGKDSEERAAGLQDATKYLNSVEQFFNTYRKDITGAAAAEKELERLRASFINSDLSPSQFKGALDQLLTKYTSEAEFNKNVLRKGVDTSPSGDAGLRAHMIADGHSPEEVDAYLAKKGNK